MKLELKHIAPYLPYGLNILEYSHGRGKDVVLPMGLKNMSDNEHKIETGITLVCSDPEIKPILRPLSDLTKEIRHDGDRFVPAVMIEGLIAENVIDTANLPYSAIVYFLKRHRAAALPYTIIEILLRLHFDIFGLIEEGLAIDINTL